MFRRPAVVLILTLLALTAACFGGSEKKSVTTTPAPTATTSGVPRFESAPCPFRPAAGQVEGKTVNCGYAVVLEEHAKSGGKTIRLAVSVYKATGTNTQAEPLVWLQGGPGGAAVESFGQTASEAIASQLTNDRDVILFDQRGTGYSQPSLFCRETTELSSTSLNRRRSRQQADGDEVTALLRCRERLVSEGVNLAAYTTAESAADVNDIRLVLGYGKVNLYGQGYGSRLALAVMRDFPNLVRATILDSPYPPQVDIYADQYANVQRAFDELYAGCNRASGCKTAYPNLETELGTLVGRLNDQPERLRVVSPRDGREREVLLTGDELINDLVTALNSREWIARIPRVIFDTRDGKFDLVSEMVGFARFNFDDLSRGAYYSVQCGEEVKFSSRGAVTDAQKKMRNQFIATALERDGADVIFPVCEKWGARPAEPVENQPVKSDIPTIVMSAQFDPRFPAAYGREISNSLSKRYVFEYAGLGSTAFVTDGCPLTMGRLFMINPDKQPDNGCTRSMGAPEWDTSR